MSPWGDRWFLDEMTISIRGERRYLWPAVDQDGDVLEIRLQKDKNTAAAKRIFRRLLKGQESVPLDITTDQHGGYRAAKRKVMRSVHHCRDRYANNRVELSHEHTRARERQMGGGFERSLQTWSEVTYA
jgi:putative transposase